MVWMETKRAQCSLKPKANPEQGPESLGFLEAERRGSRRREAGRWRRPASGAPGRTPSPSQVSARCTAGAGRRCGAHVLRKVQPGHDEGGGTKHQPLAGGRCRLGLSQSQRRRRCPAPELPGTGRLARWRLMWPATLRRSQGSLSFPQIRGPPGLPPALARLAL